MSRNGEGMGLSQEVLAQIARAVWEGDAEGARRLCQEAVDAGLTVSEITSGGLIAGMMVVAERFKNRQIFVPEVLVAARAMQFGLDVLAPHVTGEQLEPRGRVVLGTVAGDLHDIGKNLVGMMMRGAGLEVVDLGVDVPPEKFVAAVREHCPHIVGLSALLTTTMPVMKETIDALQAAGLRERVKVLVGGAPVSAEYAARIGADGYAPDAATATELALSLIPSPCASGG